MTRSRLLLISAIGFGVLYLAAVIAIGTPPEANDSGREVARWFRDHDTNARTAVWFITLAGPVFATLCVLIRERLPAPHRDLFIFGAIALGTQTAIQNWLWAGMAWHAASLEPATARTLLDVASFWGPVLTGTTMIMLGAVTAGWYTGAVRIPRWLGILGAVVFAEQLIETITVFGDDGFIAPGGPMNAYLGALLFAVWLFSLAVNLARSPASQ
jgi:hypothetical protein